jgi:hypothetical protein
MPDSMSSCSTSTATLRKPRRDAGEQVSMSTPLRQALLAQYDAHKS